MKKLPSLTLLLVGLTSGAALVASDPIGVYSVVDRVVFEPEGAKAPDRAQVWGSFMVADGEIGSGDLYTTPARGYVYFTLELGNEETSRIEWNDLATLANGKTVVGFGSRYGVRPRVREGCEAPAEPDIYSLGMGLVKVRLDTGNPNIQNLISLPGPLSPANGASSVPAGVVTLVTRNVLDPEHQGARYVFEIVIQNKSCCPEVSPEIKPGAETTEWTPQTLLRGGVGYIWTVRAIDGKWTGLYASSCFTTIPASPFIRGDANRDTKVDVADAIWILYYLFVDGPAPEPLESGDVNGVDGIDISDPLYVLGYLFQGGPAPPPPFPGTGS